MRCDDLNHEPTAESDSTARLDRLWNATRPAEPSAHDWNRVWASVADGLDRLPADRADSARRPLRMVPSLPGRARRWAAVGMIVFGQAAAILLAFTLAWGEFDRGPNGQVPLKTATAKVRIEEGQLVLIRSNADVLQVTDLTAAEGAGGVDAWYLVYNLLESLANPVVAMSE